MSFSIRVALLGTATLLASGSSSLAQVYPLWQPYGAQRGKMVIRNGLLGYRQKVHWGNGLNEYGAGVLTQLIQTTGEVLPQVVGREFVVAQASTAESEEGARELNAERSRQRSVLQGQLDQCEQKNRELETSLAQLSRSMRPAESARDIESAARELPSPAEAIKPRIRQYSVAFAEVLEELNSLNRKVSGLVENGDQTVQSISQEQAKLQAAAKALEEGNAKLRKLLGSLNQSISE